MRRLTSKRPAHVRGIMGLDLSLSGTGIVVLSEEWMPGDWDNLHTFQCGYPLSEGATPGDKVERLAKIADVIVGAANDCNVTHVFVEDYTWGIANQARPLAELGGVAKVALFDCGLIAIPVSNSSVRKLLIGIGQAKGIKKIVEAYVKKAGAPASWSNDVVDAFAVANWGRSDLDLPALTLK